MLFFQPGTITLQSVNEGFDEQFIWKQELAQRVSYTGPTTRPLHFIDLTNIMNIQ
jgi:hypothetical protein